MLHPRSVGCPLHCSALITDTEGTHGRTVIKSASQIRRRAGKRQTVAWIWRGRGVQGSTRSDTTNDPVAGWAVLLMRPRLPFPTLGWVSDLGATICYAMSIPDTQFGARL